MMHCWLIFLAAYNPGEVFNLRVDYTVNYPDGQGTQFDMGRR